MSSDDLDDDVASLSSIGSDFQRAHEDPAVRYFLLDDRHCARAHTRGNYQYIRHRLDDKCKCDHNVPPKTPKLASGLYEIHRNKAGMMLGALAWRKLEGDKLKAYLDSERKLNQDLSLLVTGLENLQSPAPPRRSVRLQKAATEVPSAQVDLTREPKATNLGATSEPPVVVVATTTAPVPPKPPVVNLPVGPAPAGLKPPPKPNHHNARWYGIRKGRTPADTGVYNSLADVHLATSGVPGAVYQDFDTMDEAQAYMDQAFTLPSRPQPSSKRWFALLSGDRPLDTGVYEDWAEVSPRIQYNPNPVCQSFPSKSLAEAYLARHHARAPPPYPGHPAPYPAPYPAPAPMPNQPGAYPTGPSLPTGQVPVPPWQSRPGGHAPNTNPPGATAPAGYMPWNAQPPPQGTYPFQAPPTVPTQPSLFYSHHELAGDSNHLFGIDARDVQHMMSRFGVPGLSPEGEHRLANQVLDAVGLPGTSAPSAKETSLSRLAEGILLIAKGGLIGEGSSAGGLIDTGWKSVKRNTIGTINSHQVLYMKTKTLQRQKQVVLSQTLSNLSKTIHHYAGYSYLQAKQLAAKSMYYRISCDNYEGYLSLHVDLLTQCADTSFADVKAQIEYHSEKLLEIRGLYSVWLQMIAHHYIFFRDGMAKGWQSLGLHKIALLSLRSSSALEDSGGKSSGTSGSAGRKVCSHCKTGLHAGNKSKCPWKALGGKEAKEAGVATLKNLGVDPDAHDG